MEEEKGGVLHIIFIFIGIALLSLGVFQFFTDEKIDLKEDPNNSNSASNQEKDDDNNQDQDKDIIHQLSIIKNVDTNVTLKSGKEVKVKYYVNEETNQGSFTYDGKTSFDTNELEQCDQYYLYNDTIISYCVFGSATSGHLYVIDSNGDSTRINDFKDNDYTFIPESITLKDDKLVVNGARVEEGAVLKIGDIEVNLCNEEEITANNISLDSPAFSEYEMKIINDNIEFNSIKTIQTIKEFISESCKSVE